ncbi:T9SS type A sorting domain-containing protein [Rufibacter latericius]|uniref:T9SS type A sorting domain-containing protein n=1 Tax=Rufibacter latericius TaxID=2487040 RepID=UPI001403FDA5|nr:T9SS type A sorting domain-containing protein [Rufibacter latericius]
MKIVKQEGGTYYVLDTTLTIAEGTTYLEAVQKLKTDTISFKRLGAKEMKSLRMSTNKDFDVIRYLPLAGHDSLRSTVFRARVADSVFTRLKAVKVFGDHLLLRDSVNEIVAKALTISGNPNILHRAITVDSLNPTIRFLRIDSVLQIKVDTLLLNETIRVEKDLSSGEMKIRKLGENGPKEILETGDYNIIRLRNPGQDRIILLKEAGENTSIRKKETLKASKKSKKKEAIPAPIELQLFPNPTNGEVNINFFSQKKAKSQVRVVDSQGKTVYQDDLGTVQGQVYKRYDLTKFGKGLYVVQVQLGKSAQSGKVVVE